jgi:hypothetical protein
LRYDMLQRNFCCKPFDRALIFHGTDILLLNWIFTVFTMGTERITTLTKVFRKLLLVTQEQIKKFTVFTETN